MSSGTSRSMLQGCNTSTFVLTPHLNITQVSWKVQLLILSIIYSRIKYFQFGGRMFQDGDLKTWTTLETKLGTSSEIYRNELEMKITRSQGHAIIFS